MHVMGLMPPKALKKNVISFLEDMPRYYFSHIDVRAFNFLTKQTAHSQAHLAAKTSYVRGEALHHVLRKSMVRSKTLPYIGDITKAD